MADITITIPDAALPVLTRVTGEYNARARAIGVRNDLTEAEYLARVVVQEHLEMYRNRFRDRDTKPESIVSKLTAEERATWEAWNAKYGTETPV